MGLGRFVGWLFILVALATAGWEIYVFFAGGKYATLSLGQLWYMLDRTSLNGIQVGLERYVWPPLWDPAMVSLLKAPAWPAFAVIGLLTAWACRDRRKRSFRR
ncbi:MAG: hypothetical protein QNJ94_07865 [Alphaproteobacteria bacterium]|nr:hypothetical protein [Alphaproteobacteria bacterium]